MSLRVWRLLMQYSLLGSLLAVLGLLLLYPIFLTIRGGLEDPRTKAFSLEPLMLVLQDPTHLGDLLNALKIAAGTTLLSLIIALPLAILSARYRYPLKGLWNAVILVPLILPPFVGAIGVRAIMGRAGALNSLLGTEWDFLGQAKIWGVILVEALHLYPIIYLNATAALANLDPALDEAAENLGAGPWRRLIQIVMPLIRPGLFAGATIVFIWSFTELGTPLMFDFDRVTPVQIFYGLKQVQASAEPFALALVMLIGAVAMYVLGKLVFGGRAYAMYSKASRAGGETPLTGFGGWMAALAFAFVTIVAVLPHIGVVLVSITSPGQWYRTVLPTSLTGSNFTQALGDPDAFGSIINSLQYAASAVIFDVLLGILAGYVIVRTKVRGRGLLDALCMMPLAVPGLIMAFGYVAVSLRWPFSADAPLDGIVGVVGTQPNPVPLLVIAYAIRRLPYIVRSTVAGLEQTSGELEEAAVNLGASRVMAVRRVIVPLIMANLVAGGLLVFSFSMLEVSDSLILAQQAKHYPITKAIFAFSERLGDGQYVASAMGVWGMALLTITLIGASMLLGKKLGSIFRV